MLEQQSRTYPRGMRVAVALALGFAAIGAGAQSSRPTVDVAVTYATLHSEHVTGADFWMQGGAVELHAEIRGGLGVVASVTGAHANSTSPQAAPLDMVTVVFGPRYTYAPRRGRLAVFGEALVGEADGFHSVFAYGSGPVSNPVNGTTNSANSLAFQTGGGLDLRVSPHFSVRALQAEYLRTQLPNGNDNLQNNLRLAAGVVYRFGRQ
jgi:outer membrane immunogenic protein